MSELRAYRPMRGVKLPQSTYGSVEISAESNVALRRLALDVFTDCANRGMDFADCLTTVLMTGLQFVVEAQKDVWK